MSNGHILSDVIHLDLSLATQIRDVLMSRGLKTDLILWKNDKSKTNQLYELRLFPYNTL